jgi:hypothetical protein
LLTTSINLNEKQKYLLISAVFIIGAVLFIALSIVPGLKSYNKEKIEDSYLNEEIDKQYQEVVRLQRLKEEFLKSDRYLKEAKLILSMDSAEILNMLTKNSPVENFTQASIEMKNMKATQEKVSQYPFDISFAGSFEKIRDYLYYQETALPLSVIKSIEIIQSEESTTILETSLNGILYRIN